MSDEIDQKKPAGSESPPPEPEKVKPRRKRKRSLKLDADAVVRHVLETYSEDLRLREPLILRRMERYAQFRGWLEEKSWPWENCANVWMPIMLMSTFRFAAVLENATKGIRPMLQSRALQSRNVDKQERIDNVLDYQFFTENKGEDKLDALIQNFTQDEAAFAFVPWTREDQTIREIRMLPGLPPEIDVDNDEHIPHLLALIPAIFDWPNENFGNATAVGREKDIGWIWEVVFPDAQEEEKRVRVEFFERDDGKLEAMLSYKARTFDGPSIQVLDFEDVVFPNRSANLQIPTGANPLGAPYVAIRCKMQLDQIRRWRENGTYDLLTDEAMEAIEKGKSPTNSGQTNERPKEQKDELEGTDSAFSYESKEREVIRWYGGWDVDRDGLDEQEIFSVVRLNDGTGYLAKATFLSELYPGVPPLRPIVSFAMFPVTNRVCGISFPELLESFQDQTQITMDQHLDWGTITNTPFFAYRASSSMEGQPIYIEPAMGIPLDDPANDLHFPQFPQKGETFSINTITMLMQFIERIQMFSDFSYGRVPTGKASALRTLGTTASLLGQADVRSEQILRRLFFGFAQIYQLMHRLNRYFLPQRKEIRIMGVSEQGKNPFVPITPTDVDADIDFEFRATMFNTNKQILSQALMEISALLISPLAVQAGIITPNEMYNLFRDVAKARDLPYERYVRRPVTANEPKILAEDAISAILDNETPVGVPLEGALEHYKKLVEFAGSDDFALLSAMQLGVFKTWLEKVQALAAAEQQRLALAQAAASLQGQGGNGQGGVPTTIGSPGLGDNPPVNTGELIDESAGGVQ